MNKNRLKSDIYFDIIAIKKYDERYKSVFIFFYACKISFNQRENLIFFFNRQNNFRLRFHNLSSVNLN